MTPELQHFTSSFSRETPESAMSRLPLRFELIQVLPHSADGDC